MIYVFIAYDCYPFPIARHLIDEGHEVIYSQVESRDHLRLPGIKENEEPEDRKERLSNYEGLIEKQELLETLHQLKKVKKEDQDDYFFFFDFNDMYKISEAIMAMGFRQGLFPTELYYRMEKERESSKKFVKKYYDKVKVAESIPFEKVKDAIDHIEDSDEIFVLKSNGNMGRTVVPKTDDVDIAKKQVVDALEKEKKEYEKGGFILEKKIKDCLELTPIIVFYNGKPVYSVVEIENKAFGAGNIGAQKGGNQVLNIRTDLNCEINKISFPSIIHEMAKKQPGLSIYDAGLLYDKKDFYFTEFCAMRYGWDGIFAEMVMRDEGKPFVAGYFEDIMKGKSPLKKKYGIAIRLFNYEGDLEDTMGPESGVSISWDDSIENNLFMYCVRKEGEETVCTGDRDFIGCITGASNSLDDAVKITHERIERVHFDKLYHRPQFDFVSKDYRSSIMNRLDAIGSFI